MSCMCVCTCMCIVCSTHVVAPVTGGTTLKLKSVQLSGPTGIAAIPRGKQGDRLPSALGDIILRATAPRFYFLLGHEALLKADAWRSTGYAARFAGALRKPTLATKLAVREVRAKIATCYVLTEVLTHAEVGDNFWFEVWRRPLAEVHALNFHHRCYSWH